MLRDTKSESDTATELVKAHPEGFVREAWSLRDMTQNRFRAE